MASRSLSQGGRFRVISAVIIIPAALRASCRELPSQLALRLEELPGCEVASAENPSRAALLHPVWPFQIATQKLRHTVCRVTKRERDGYRRGPAAYRARFPRISR